MHQLKQTQNDLPIADVAIMRGVVQHQRFQPKPHRFRYTLQQLWINVERFDSAASISPLWSSKRRNLVELRRQDYLPSDRSLYAEVKNQIAQRCNQSFSGSIYLIASPRVFGQCFNPVSFFACYSDSELKFLVAEVHNTPWNERAVYVHQLNNSDQAQHQASFEKHFHVSPFMPMDLQYHWRFRVSNKDFKIRMQLNQADQVIFTALMNLKSQPISRLSANLLPIRYGFHGLKVLLAIYWQAAKMWLKRFPIYPHPKAKKQAL